LLELIGGRAVADNPVDFVAVLVDKKFGRGALDIEFFVDRVPDLVAAAGAVDDKIVVEKIGVLGIVVELLNQQFTGPSATREKIDEDELVFLFGLGQRLVEGATQDLCRLGRGERGDEEQAGDRSQLFHSGLLMIRSECSKASYIKY